jgi:membrane-associated protein
MNLGEQLLTALSLYGIPILASVLFIGCLGAPLPNALLLIASGSFVAGGQMNLWTVLIVASAASIAGDVAGYLLGRWLGRRALHRLAPKLHQRMLRAEESLRKWGAWGIFLTRWLITPIGPWVNLISGASKYPWLRFVIWDVLGEVLWVALYVSLGRVVASEVQAISSLAGDISWVMLALVIAVVLCWLVLRSRRPSPVEVAED